MLVCNIAIWWLQSYMAKRGKKKKKSCFLGFFPKPFLLQLLVDLRWTHDRIVHHFRPLTRLFFLPVCTCPEVDEVKEKECNRTSDKNLWELQKENGALDLYLIQVQLDWVSFSAWISLGVFSLLSTGNTFGLRYHFTFMVLGLGGTGATDTEWLL